MRRRDVSALWIGGPLGHLEQLALTSFRDHGFSVNLYTYDEVGGVPSGIAIVSADEILPKNSIFENKARPGTFSGFSNIFRYRLLQLKKTTWIDTDVVCLDENLPSGNYLFAWESKKFVNGAVLRAPSDSTLLELLYTRAVAVEPASIQWGQLGPRLITSVVKELGLENTVARQKTIYPLSYREIWQVFDPSMILSLRRKTQGSPTLHLWNEVLRNTPAKTQAPPPGSFLAELMERHDIAFPREQLDVGWLRRDWRPQINPRPFESGFMEQRAGRLLRLMRLKR